MIAETRVVPVEATDEMIEAAWDSDAADYVGEHKRIHNLGLAWKIMLSAALPTADAQVTVSEMVRTAPERIWIDVSEDEDHHDEPFPDDVEYVAWSMTRGAASAVEYVRADIAASDAAQGDDARDAARYRWLREKRAVPHGSAPLAAGIQCQTGPYFNREIYGSELDAAIDSALTQAQPQAVPGE